MPTPRSLWRALLTVVQIVTLVAFSVAGTGHSHAGPTQVGHTHLHAAASGHPEAAGAAHVADMSDQAERAGGEASDPCGLNCCHASIVRPEACTIAVSWLADERRLAGIAVIAFDSVTPETLPEPPRTFA